MFPIKAPSVSGPVAITAGSVGISVISREMSSIFGCFFSSSVIRFEKSVRSTASAPPAGTRVSSAILITRESIRRSSSFKRPTALSSLSERSEFEQTNSHRSSVLCAGECLPGFISKRLTCMPLSAITYAASQPANPPPITETDFIAFLLLVRV